MASTRIVPLSGACNFRDLGGYPTVDGRRTRWGRLFRSDNLHDLTPADLEVLRELGLATVVDLRTDTEVQRDGRGPLDLAYHHLSVLRDGSAPPVDWRNMGQRYLWYLDVGGTSLATALDVLADEAGHPLVFHCTAGKDRTGVLAALVLACIGVERESIVADYVETGARLDLILARLRRHPVYGEQLSETPASDFTVEATGIEQFLDGLDRRFGGARAWAVSAGVGEDRLARLEASLLEERDM